ncbi:unnamed protein product [Cuscuta campestris]|uniref:Uncharacterized protein n=1 Tax=Cuscuta campestris TaxID=132261 RepID=A0A484NCT7_9ASTE|nr:unnamed protein product [Cuscuta campestris]
MLCIQTLSREQNYASFMPLWKRCDKNMHPSSGSSRNVIKLEKPNDLFVPSRLSSSPSEPSRIRFGLCTAICCHVKLLPYPLLDHLTWDSYDLSSHAQAQGLA